MSRPIVRKLRPPSRKIAGARGQWTADVEGVEMAVLHNSWRVGTTGYFDPMDGFGRDGKKHADLVRALEAGDIAVIQRDKSGDPALSRDGYVGLFRFKDLEIGENGSIRLTLVDRVQ